MEDGVVNQILQGPLGDVFENRQLITDVYGSGNNWYALHSRKYSVSFHCHFGTSLCLRVEQNAHVFSIVSLKVIKFTMPYSQISLKAIRPFESTASRKLSKFAMPYSQVSLKAIRPFESTASRKLIKFAMPYS